MTQCWSCAMLFIVLFISHVAMSRGQDTATETDEDKMFEMGPNDLILVNVAAKGRVVELLANELARTEIIRALLVEYAKECVTNITALEKTCLDCMMNRCQNRRQECHIEGPPLSEMINHDPSPVQGLQFLSQGPRDVTTGMKNFANRARTDILQGVPEALRKESEAIMQIEVEQSLRDLNDNIDTDKALRTISLHVQKAADNVHKLPNIGEKVGSIIVDNEDRAVNLAQLLGRKLKQSRPFLESINHNGARIMEKMPDVLVQVEDRVTDFKSKVSGVFSRVMDTFQKVMDSPETPVQNGNMMGQPQLNQFQQSPNFMQTAPGGPNMALQHPGGSQMMGNQAAMQQLQQARMKEQQLRQQLMQQQMQQQQQQQMLQNQMLQNQIPQQGQQGFQQQQRMQGIPAQPFGQGPDSQVQMVALEGQIQPQFQGQSAVFQGQNAQPGMAAGNMQPDMSNIVPLNPQQNFQPQAIDQRQGQMQGQVSVGGRRKRHDDPDCKRLEDNPDKYCRKFEPECHNCTLEKRLRFEVCGEGVERARDEIKRIDESVANYLKAYNEYVAKEKLVFKVEYNSKNRLRKTTSYFDAMITAKVGPSVFTFKSKMIINIKDVRATGSQIGDEIWEKLWENEVFAEAKEILLPIRKENILGQAQVKDVHSAHAQTNPTGGSQSIVPSCSAIMCAILSTVVLLL